MEIGANSTREADEKATDVVDLSWSTAPTPEAPLSAPITIDSTTNLSILGTTRTTTNTSEVDFGRLILRYHKSVPSVPSYVLIPFSIYCSHALGTIHHLLVGVQVYHNCCRFLLS